MQTVNGNESVYRRIETKDDISQPILISTRKKKPEHVHEADDSYNAYVMRQRESAGKRTLIRVSVEVYCRKSAKNMGFSRLRNKHIIVSCPSADQAELVIDTLMQVAEMMHGKLLVKST